MTRTMSRLVIALLAFASFAQQPATSPKPIPMPSDRAADSYAIYSQLLQGIALDLGNVARKVWLVEDTTIIPLSPLYAHIQPPLGREADLQALFDDYVRHESETIALTADGFHTELPVRLMDEAARKRFRESVRFGHAKDPVAGAEFDSSAGMHRFSQVYFNPTHTLAMVHFGMDCGGGCGAWRWIVLEHRDGRWVPLPWVHSFMIE